MAPRAILGPLVADLADPGSLLGPGSRRGAPHLGTCATSAYRASDPGFGPGLRPGSGLQEGPPREEGEMRREKQRSLGGLGALGRLALKRRRHPARVRHRLAPHGGPHARPHPPLDSRRRRDRGDGRLAGGRRHAQAAPPCRSQGRRRAARREARAALRAPQGRAHGQGRAEAGRVAGAVPGAARVTAAVGRRIRHSLHTGARKERIVRLSSSLAASAGQATRETGSGCDGGR